MCVIMFLCTFIFLVYKLHAQNCTHLEISDDLFISKYVVWVVGFSGEVALQCHMQINSLQLQTVSEEVTEGNVCGGGEVEDEGGE